MITLYRQKKVSATSLQPWFGLEKGMNGSSRTVRFKSACFLPLMEEGDSWTLIVGQAQQGG